MSAPLSGQRALRAEGASGGVPFRRGLRDGDRDDHESARGLSRVAEIEIEASSTARPAGRCAASRTATASSWSIVRAYLDRR